MPVPLIPVTINNPGSKGLNTQDETSHLNPSWATVLENAVFDNAGRVASRKGFTVLTTSSSYGAFDINQVHCFEDGTNTVVISAGNDLLMYGTTTLTSITGSVASSANNWQFQNWNTGSNKKIVAWQSGETPIVSTVTAGTPGNFAVITVSDGGTLPDGNCCLAAFGRIWASDDDNVTIRYSALLNETQWATASGAGSFTTAHYWPRGMDFVTAIAAWEDKLVVFGKRNILIYDSPDTIANFPTLLDTVEGVGCVARDSVQVIGSDILFLSETGLRSLRRTLETEKNPLQEVGVQVRDLVVSYISGNESKIRSVYSQADGFYLLVIPDSNDPVTFMYDLKGLRVRDLLGKSMLDLDNVRVSIWRGWDAKGVAYGRNGILYGSFRDSGDSNEGVIGSYSGYLDNESTYVLCYTSPWIDLSNTSDVTEGSLSMSEGTFLKIPKQFTVTIVGGSGYTVTVNWSFDYSDSSYSGSFAIPSSGATTSEWGTTTNQAEWGISEWGYSSSTNVNPYKVHGAGSGTAIRFGISAPVNNTNIALQRIDLFMKQGRLSR